MAPMDDVWTAEPLTLQGLREVTAETAPDTPLRARTPHGSFTFDVTGVTWDEQGRAVLHLREVERASRTLDVDSMGRPKGSTTLHITEGPPEVRFIPVPVEPRHRA